MTQQHNMAREFFLGFIKIHILHHAAEEAVHERPSSPSCGATATS